MVVPGKIDPDERGGLGYADGDQATEAVAYEISVPHGRKTADILA